MTEKIKNIAIIILIVLLGASGGFGVYFFIKGKSIQSDAIQARVDAQNRIAQLSHTLKEGEGTWSRLAQEKEAELDDLRERIPELVTLIEERDEEITSLTEAVGRLQNVRVVVDSGNVTQTPEEPTEPGQPERTRVAFDQIWNDFMRIHGFTLTNPAEAEINVDYTRPVRVSVVTTQQEDLSWRSYISHNISNLEIETIESIVNPLARPQEESHWYENIMLGIGGSVGVQGQMGTAYLFAGYDAGDWDLGITLGGIFTSNGVDFAPGLEFRFAPFSL